jgi:hypothetical protein
VITETKINPPEKKPSWLKVKLPTGQEYTKVREIVSEHKLHTICQSGNCPNMGECWGAGTATFMILGNICTRSCGFCSVATGKPEAVDPFEPLRVAKSVNIYSLDYFHRFMSCLLVNLNGGWHTPVHSEPSYFFLLIRTLLLATASIQLVLILTRVVFNLKEKIKSSVITLVNKFLILFSSILIVINVVEFGIAMYSDVQFDSHEFINSLIGNYWWAYWLSVLVPLIFPQLLWFKKIRTNIALSFLIAILINSPLVGKIIEIIFIAITSIHREYIK